MNSLISQIDETRALNNKQYRKFIKDNEVSKFYHPYLHIGWNIGILFLLSLGSALMIENWNLGVLGVYAFTLLLGNFTVWALHKYPLHRRKKISSYAYERHTVMHHRYFTQDFITYDEDMDFFAVFFPMIVIFGFAIVAQPIFYFSFKYLFGSNLAFAFASGTAMYFLLYEFVHWSCHLAENHPLQKIPWLSGMRKHHLIHHNPKLMKDYNFCIVYPLMDYVMGTKYKGDTIPKDDPNDHYLDVKANSP
ncbi:MAG TPA: sterol desaturase family protein [Bacteriovoracaceae bacterium]|nr:sterol desaturase family protein [Bacteriovoracaceae bacterium]